MSSSDVTVAELLHDLHRLRKSVEEAQSTATECCTLTNKYLKSFGSANVVLSEKDLSNLLRNYKETKTIISKTEKNCGACLDRIAKIEKRKFKKNTEPHPVVGAKRFKGDSSFSIPRGRQVAARTSKDKDYPEEWILAAIVNYDEHKQLYEVEDEDPGDESEPEPYRKHYNLPCYRLIPLPEGDKIRDITKGTEVLAMFPNTTTFYKAVVEQPPKGKKNPDYTVKFDDDDDENGETPLRKVKAKYVVLRSDTAKS